MKQTLVIALVGLAVLVGCAKKNNVNELPKDSVRTLVPGFSVYSSFESELHKKGLYTPDNCIQFVKVTQGDKEIGSYLELSAVPCPGSTPVNEEDVIARLPVQKHDTYFTQLHVRESNSNASMGMIRQYTVSGEVSYRLEGLCDIDVTGSSTYTAEWANMCAIRIESSLFASDLFQWSPNL